MIWALNSFKKVSSYYNYTMELLKDRYRIEKKLGSGSFSVVYMGTDIKLNRKVAIKQIKITTDTSKITPEIEIMKKLNHPNIVKYYDAIETNNCMYIVMEYCNAGSLQDVINLNEKMGKNKNFNREANTYYFMTQFKDALNYVREMGYIHRDIKPMNVLLSKEVSLTNDGLSGSMETDSGVLNILFGACEENVSSNTEIDYDCTKSNLNYKLTVKLADFGLARQYVDNTQSLMRTYCGSPRYMGPELLLSMEYNSKTDLWSCGVMMYEMLFGVGPLEAKTLEHLKKKVRKDEINFHLNRNYSADCFDLLTKLLDKDYETRIEWDQFFTHHWFRMWERHTNLNSSIEEKAPNMPTKSTTKAITIPKSSNLTKMTVSDYTRIPTTPKSYAEYHNLLKKGSVSPSTPTSSTPSSSSSNNSLSPNSPLFGNKFINQQALQKSLSTFSI